MHVILFGATGMVGAGVLLECLEDARVDSVLAIVRSPTGRTHPKLREVVHADFFSYDDLRDEFQKCDSCFFCLGVSSAGMSEAKYAHLTYDLTLAAATRPRRLRRHGSPSATSPVPEPTARSADASCGRA